MWLHLRYLRKHQLGKLRRPGAVENSMPSIIPPPSSALLEGCVETGVCSTKGGAVYNFSGIQGCVWRPLRIHCAALKKQYLKMVGFPGRLVDQLKDNISDEKVFTKLNAIDKFGNDIPEADKWMIWLVSTTLITLRHTG